MKQTAIIMNTWLRLTHLTSSMFPFLHCRKSSKESILLRRSGAQFQPSLTLPGPLSLLLHYVSSSTTLSPVQPSLLNTSPSNSRCCWCAKMVFYLCSGRETEIVVGVVWQTSSWCFVLFTWSADRVAQMTFFTRRHKYKLMHITNTWKIKDILTNAIWWLYKVQCIGH